ncbi:MAG: transposase [Bacteroidetes bacterium]|nr:transposase [Bacteroidota bacterium]
MYIGGKEINRHASKKKGLGSGPAGKQAVVGLRERGGRFEAKAIDAADKPIVQGMIKEYVETGSTVYTDDHRSYSGLAKKDYRHKSVKHSADKYAREVVHTNGIESVWSVI